MNTTEIIPLRAWPLAAYLNVHPTADDRVRLAPNLESWTRLNELLVLDQFNVRDLKLLLIFEVSGAMRQQVLRVLRSRIKTKESKHIDALIHVSRT